MSLIQMSLAGSVMILVIAALRALFLNKLPKKMFLILWWAALIRLLVPVSLPFEFSVYSLLPQQIFLSDGNGLGEQEITSRSSLYQGKVISDTDEDIVAVAEDLQPGTALEVAGDKGLAKGMPETGITVVSKSSLWQIIWAAGALFSSLFFLSVYIRGCREFRSSFPVEKEMVKNWEECHKGRRRILVRWSERIRTPLSYGMIHPVILMPKDTDWKDDKQLSYVLEHEYVHIKRLDAVTKQIFTAALCVHWFNPLVWVMYLLLNRDLEISCDEEVVRHFGEDTKSGYARALIGMEEKKAGLPSFSNGFGKIAIEERIRAIMKMKKTSVFALAAAVLLVAAVVLGFGTTAKAGKTEQREYVRSAFDTFYTEEESKMLADLWIDDYEDMTVSEYQEKIWSMTDTPEYIHLIDDFSKTAWAFESDEKEGEALNQYFQYYDYVFSPLSAERWKQREFSGAAIWREGQVYSLTSPEQGNSSADTAMLEYVMTLQVEDPDRLTTAQYRDTRLQVEKDMEEILKSKSEVELADVTSITSMDQYLEKETKRIASEESSENLTVIISYSFLPLEHAKSQENQDLEREKKEIQVRIENQLEAINRLSEQIRMVEYQQIAEKNKADEISAIVEELEKRQFPSASKEDYESLLELMKPDYKNMSIAEFDDVLRNWCNEDYDRMERIGEDAARGEYGKVLTPEEKSFVDLTYGLSGEENHRIVNNMRAGEPEKEEDLRYGWISRDFYKASYDGRAWVNCWYAYYWYITDRDKLTVGDRDARIKGFMEEVERKLSDTDLDELLEWETEDFTALLKETAQEYSSDLLRIEVAEENVSVEHMDERELAAEQSRRERERN